MFAGSARRRRRRTTMRTAYGQSPYWDSGFRRAWLRQNLNLKGWNSHVHRESPEMLSQAILEGIIIVGRLGVRPRHIRTSENQTCAHPSMHTSVHPHIHTPLPLYPHTSISKCIDHIICTCIHVDSVCHVYVTCRVYIMYMYDATSNGVTWCDAITRCTLIMIKRIYES